MKISKVFRNYIFGSKTIMADKTHVKKGEIVTTVKEKAKLCCESRKHSNNILDILTLSQVKYITSIIEILHTCIAMNS